MTEVTLPAITSEKLEVPLVSWDATVAADPTTLTWKCAVSATYARESGAAPPVADAVWVAATCVNRGTVQKPSYRILVPVNALPAGTYGVWVRVAGASLASPARWAGAVKLR